jgi:23S rRNA (guanosine2251-2'-O)-methyltransferase
LRAERRRFGQLLVRPGASASELGDLVERARALGLSVREADAAELSRDLAPQDRVPAVALDVGPLPLSSLERLCAGSAGTRRLVALDGVEDPQNLGAIARVAEAAGVDGLVLTERRSPPLGAAASRASAGALEWLPVARVANLARALESLKSEGFWIVGADAEAGPSLFEVPERVLQGDLVVVLGAEGKGLRPLVRRHVDHPVRIPMEGRVASLNVATASAVILFELLRRSKPIVGSKPVGQAGGSRGERAC